MKRRAIRWKKVGGGSLRFRGRDIKQGEIFTAAPEELPKTFLRRLEALDPIPEPKGAEPIPKALPPSFDIEFVGGGWYNVVASASGKPINEKRLRKADAEKLLEQLTS